MPIELSEQTRQYNEMLPPLLDKINGFWDYQERLLLQMEDLYQKLVDNYKHWGDSIQNIRKDVI